MVLGEFIQTVWASLQGNVDIKSSDELEAARHKNNVSINSASLPQGAQFLRYPTG